MVWLLYSNTKRALGLHQQGAGGEEGRRGPDIVWLLTQQMALSLEQGVMLELLPPNILQQLQQSYTFDISTCAACSQPSVARRIS